MKDIKKEICAILKIDDEVVADFVLDIFSKYSLQADFIKQIQDLEVGISREKLVELYFKLSQAGKSDLTEDIHEQAKLGVNLILKEELGLEDRILVDFIDDICSKANSLAEFYDSMSSMGCGLSTSVIFRIYKELKSTNTVKHDRYNDEKLKELSLPNTKPNWCDIRGEGYRELELDDVPVEGRIYSAKVKKITSFGCFVRIFGTKETDCDGLVHISELSSQRISTPKDVVQVGQSVYVKVLNVKPNGKISLSRKAVDQQTGEELEREGPVTNKRTHLRRQLTSSELWEIMQSMQSGVVSINEFPELKDQIQLRNWYKDSESSKRHSNYEETIDIELNKDYEPKFLTGQLQNLKKPEMPTLFKVPKGSLSNNALNGSRVMNEHRKEKLKKKKEIESKLRKQKVLDDPSMRADADASFQDKQLVLTAWERSRMKEKIKYGKRVNLPIKKQRESLPIFNLKNELIKAISDNQFVVIVGETGSGKTTQLTQYLYEEGFADNGTIGCTQPRRVAAVSVAKRVAEEMGCTLGKKVGYTIRFEDVTSSETKIKYMTDGMLQKEALFDSEMSNYSVILLDEAHERTVATDVLFALLKKAASTRSDLKVIITSATLDATKFSKYFLDCPIINIPGRTFPVEVKYAQTPHMDYIESVLDTVTEIHINEDRGDILVFLTGQDEIDTCCEILFERFKTLGNVVNELIILPVYSALPSEIQSKIFEPTPEGARKVIFATNIAETSITIDGIRYVVDSGFAKINTFNPFVGMEQLIVSPISQAQANQRKGRAGRTACGKCFRLYTEDAFNTEMLPNSIPEILRQNLEHTILMLKAMGINDLLHFEFMDPPSKSSMIQAFEALYNLQALDDDGYLTKLGKQMSQFPMEPALSKSLMASVQNSCSEEMLNIISMLSVQSVFYRPKDKQQEADLCKARFHHPYGDHLTLLNVYTRWQENNFTRSFCTKNYLNERHMRRARDVKNQLIAIFRKLDLPITSCQNNFDLVRKTLVAGFFRNAAKRDPQLGYKTIAYETTVSIHPSSSLFSREHEYLIYHSLVLTAREYMSHVTVIEPQWLLENAPHFYKTAVPDSTSRKKAKIVPLHNKFSKDQDSWRLSSIRQSKEKALGIKR